MIPKVIEHSVGMVSVDAGELSADAETLERVKDTELYRRLAAWVGAEEADQMLQGSGGPSVRSASGDLPHVTTDTFDSSTEDSLPTEPEIG